MNLEVEKIPEEKIEISTAQELYSILYTSYQLSQGSYNLQEALLGEASKHIHIHNGLTTSEGKEKIAHGFLKALGINLEQIKSNSNPDETVNTFTLAMAKKHQPPTNKSVASEHTNINEYIDILSGEIDGYPTFESEPSGKSRIIECSGDIIREIWFRDYKFLQQSTGRPNKKQESDTWYSAGVSHLIHDKSTKNKVFDRVYIKLRQLGSPSQLTESFLSDEDFQSINGTVSIYNVHHPDDPVGLEELKAYIGK